MTAWSYDLHGLRVRSGMVLAGRPGSPDEPDLFVQLGPPRTIGVERPPGRVVAELVSGEWRWYTIVHEDGYVLRFHDVCDVTVSHDLSRVTCHPNPGLSPDVAGVLVAGTVMAFIVAMRGGLVLHASTVQHGDQTIAVVGASGTGKSTTAAVLCAAGARLVGDDVLVVEPGDRRCLAGTSAIRLRSSVWCLADGIHHERPAMTTGDGRLAAFPPLADASPPLSLIAIPRPRPSDGEIRVAELAPADALMRLLRVPRIDGWRLDEPRRRYFEGVADLARNVRVVIVDVPWTLPPDAQLGAHILQSLTVPGTG